MSYPSFVAILYDARMGFVCIFIIFIYILEFLCIYIWVILWGCKRIMGMGAVGLEGYIGGFWG